MVDPMDGNKKSACTWLLSGAVMLLAASAAPGCVVSTNDPGPPVVVVPAGALVLQWTVNEGTDPNVCIQSGASTLDVRITTTDGQFAGEFQASCTQFQTSISQLGAGSYVADAQLLDGSGGARTTTIHVDPFTLGSADLVISVDFPADSFF